MITITFPGPREAHHMVKFLEMIVTPLKRMSTAEDLVNLLSVYDVSPNSYTITIIIKIIKHHIVNKTKKDCFYLWFLFLTNCVEAF